MSSTDKTGFINNNLLNVVKPTAPQCKPLTPSQAVTAACTLFELNVNDVELQDMAARAALPWGADEAEGMARLKREWFGFVHASIMYAMMGKVTARTMSGYIGSTRELMQRFAGYDAAASDAFVDNTLTAYIEKLTANEQRQCPFILLRKVLEQEPEKVLNKDQLAFVSGMMAITLCNILDTLDRYTYLPDEVPVTE